MKMPLICMEGPNCITLFSTLEEASIELEPIDIWNNEYTFFDADGYAVEAYVEGGTNPANESSLSKFFPSNNGQIRFIQRIPLEKHEEELVKTLTQYLKNYCFEIQTKDLEILIGEILRIENWYKYGRSRANVIVRFLQKFLRKRTYRLRNSFSSQNHEVAVFIRSFVKCSVKHNPYFWSDLMLDSHTNPDVSVAVELINEFGRRFPARHNFEYCAPEADPYFFAIADLLEEEKLHVNGKWKIEPTRGVYSPKMKELIECVESRVERRK